MRDSKVKKIDFSRRRIASLADKFYNEGDYLSALRFAYKEFDLYGGDAEVYARLADIYEGMGLQGTAVNWWFRFLDIAEDADLPEVYEGLAVNFLNMGNESQSAYYYNKLIRHIHHRILFLWYYINRLHNKIFLYIVFVH